MATEGIILDIGTIYKRLFNHRAIIQNEVQYFIHEFETKRGDNDLKLLQSSVKLASDINALYLEEMKESLPRFAEAQDKITEIVSKGNNILEKSPKDFEIPAEQTTQLETEIQELKDKYSKMRKEYANNSTSRIEELKSEAEVHRETIERLKGGGHLGSPKPE